MGETTTKNTSWSSSRLEDSHEPIVRVLSDQLEMTLTLITARQELA